MPVENDIHRIVNDHKLISNQLRKNSQNCYGQQGINHSSLFVGRNIDFIRHDRFLTYVKQEFSNFLDESLARRMIA